MNRKQKKLVSLVLALFLFAAITTPAFAASGYNSKSGYNGSFSVYLPSGGSTGQVTIRVISPEQNQAIWITVTDPNGRTVWNRSSLEHGLLPNNGAEIKSPTFSNAVAGNYTVSFGGLANITLQCWVYSW